MDKFFLFQRAFAGLWIYSALPAPTQSSHTSCEKLSLCQHFWSSAALLDFFPALSYNKDIPYSQIPIKSIHGKWVIPNLYRFRIHRTKRCALQLCSMQERKSRMPASNVSCEINSKLLMHHPKFPLIRKYQPCYALKKHQHFPSSY